MCSCRVPNGGPYHYTRHRAHKTILNSGKPHGFSRHGNVHHGAAHRSGTHLKYQCGFAPVFSFVVETSVAEHHYAVLSRETTIIVTVQTVRASPEIVALYVQILVV
ncbi:hypothetical protein TNCV_2690231 [Trichonephila clavipes]|uniref:Uncharacterized protein n=1 Tax=Trichonephila clavipes TaxID=2585209 RepID=A0A8X6VYB8_TRICX|nr:hypothetical protein TNCV_2690231 [Trichonephila clavipes]